jgi:uncharacterized protein YegP (UPF0339 family)
MPKSPFIYRSGPWVIYQDIPGEYRWRYTDPNNKKIQADSGEGYKRYGSCLKGIKKITDKFSVAAVAGFPNHKPRKW